MNEDTVNKITADLKKQYPEAGIRSIEVDETSGKSTFYLNPTKQALAFLDKDKAATPHIHRSNASVMTKDILSRSLIQLNQGKDAYDEDPINLYSKALRYYYTDPLVGSALAFLSSIACKGFENDIDDPDIKNFYDSWTFDVKFEELLEWVFLDFFRISQVTTYKYIAAYEPGISTVSPKAGKKAKKPKKVSGKELAAKKNIWSKGHLPIGYTVLNPLLVTIDGNLLFDNVSISMKMPDELKKLLTKDSKDLSLDEKTLIKNLPSDVKNAATSGSNLVLDSRLVSTITYKKMPYERYARPRIARVFDSLDYKRALKDADLSTLEGISNYILKVTIGNDEYPATTQEELTAVASLFNTPNKSFDVVWNHTLKVEKIVSPEIASILGQEKYAQVNDDITSGLSMTRALIDGGSLQGKESVDWAIRGVREDIDYARRQVTRWIYDEYRQIAEAMGFDRFPKVRWDEGILKDDILYKNVIANMVDRRMLSYNTALETLGFDFDNELSNMQVELPLVEQGFFGLIGSPFQKSAGGPAAQGTPGGAPVDPNASADPNAKQGVKVQPTQKAPKGTPSAGRPTGQTNTKTKVTDPNKLQDNKIKKKAASLEEIIKGMEVSERATLINMIKGIDNE